MNWTLLLTGTIQPNPGLPGRVLMSAEIREAAYLRNLQWWLNQPERFSQIVFVENSGASLQRLEEGVAKAGCKESVELLSVSDNDFTGEFGKGYGEARLIDVALKSARSLQGPGHVVKVTGLQVVANITRLLRKAPLDLNLLVDLREHNFYKLMGSNSSGHGCDTRCFLFEKSFYRDRLAGQWQGHQKGEFYLEDSFYATARSLKAEKGVYLRFPVEPRYRGLAGHWGKDYDSPSQRAKWLVRAAVRTVAPGLWI